MVTITNDLHPGSKPIDPSHIIPSSLFCSLPMIFEPECSRDYFDPGKVGKCIFRTTRRHYANGLFCAYSNKLQKSQKTGENCTAITVEQNIFLFDRVSSDR